MFPVPETALVLENDPNVTLQEVVSANIVRINVNSAHPPLDNVDVRRAISLAIDRQEMVDAALLGKGAPSSHIPQAYAWSISPEDQPYNTRDVAVRGTEETVMAPRAERIHYCTRADLRS